MTIATNPMSIAGYSLTGAFAFTALLGVVPNVETFQRHRLDAASKHWRNDCDIEDRHEHSHKAHRRAAALH